MSESDEQNRPSLESLKYLAILAGIVLVVGGLGWIIFRWSEQMGVAPNPGATTNVNANPVVPVVPTTRITESGEAGPVTVVVDPLKPGALDQLPPDYDITKQPFPAWASTDPPDPRDLPTLTVGPGVATATHFTTLDEALRAAGKDRRRRAAWWGTDRSSMSPIELGRRKETRH